MDAPGWYPFASGSTIGQTGTENGVILRDEEHTDGARITLERDGYTPFAITCGIYGWMVHTRFFSSAEEANGAFEAMQVELAHIFSLIPSHDDPELDARVTVLGKAIEVFVREFP